MSDLIHSAKAAYNNFINRMTEEMYFRDPSSPVHTQGRQQIEGAQVFIQKTLTMDKPDMEFKLQGEITEMHFNGFTQSTPSAELKKITK